MAQDIYTQGFDAWLRRGEDPNGVLSLDLMGGSGVDSSSVNSMIGGGSVDPIGVGNIGSGELGSLIGYGKKTFAETSVNGWLQGLDSDNTYKWIIGVTGNQIDWNVTTTNTLTLAGTIAVIAGAIAGLTITATALTATAGGNSTIVSSGSTAFTAGPTGAPTFTVTQAGALTSTSGTIAGWTINPTTLANSTNIILDASNKAISIKDTTFGNDGLQFQYNAGNPRAYIGDGGNYFFNFDGTNISWGAVNSALSTAGLLTTTSALIGGWNVVSGYIYNLVGGTPTIAPSDGVVLASGNEALIIYEDTEKRTELGYLSAGVYGLKVYATNGTSVIFEASDAQQKVAGWNFTDTVFRSGATDAASNVLIDSANSLIRLGPTTGDYLTIDGANQRIRSSNYVSGFAGAGITFEPNLLEVGNIAVRGLLRTYVLQKDIISAHAGSLIISPTSDVLDADMTALDASTMTIKGTSTFAVNDRLRIKDGTDDEWFLVTNIAAAPTYTVTRDQASVYGVNVNPTWKKGASVVNYGQSGAGGLYLTASDTNSPYLSVFTHAGSPWSALTTRLRLGNLNGYLGYVADTYGLGVGSSSGTDANITIDPTNGIRIRQGTTNKITFDNAGNATLLNLTVGGALTVGTAGTLGSGQSAYDTGVGFWLEYNAATPRMSLGNSAGNKLTWDGTTLSITGTLTASAGAIGGFSIGADYIRDAANSFGLASTVTAGDDIRFWAGDTFANRATAPFRVTEAGVLVSSSATITGAITATSGAIGGWVVDATSIKDAAGVVGMSSAVTGGDDIRFWAGDVTPASAEFRVTEAGALTASSATITGAITATSGTIGSFTIGTYLYTGTKTAYNDVNAGVHLGSDGIGIGNNVFTVSSAGALVATSATITGAITATSGAIGGWVVGSTSLTDAAGLVGMSSAVTGGDDYRFWAGHVTASSAPFSVTEAGVIKATSGTIGGNALGTTFISSTTFVSGPLGSGWRIMNTGVAEFQDVTVRGTIRTSVFEKDTISAINGIVLISKADVLASAMTALDASTLTISGETTFVANEVIRIKDGTDDEYMLVTNAAAAPTYTVTRDLAGAYAVNTNPIWTKGTAVVSMGVGTGTKTGFILLDSSSASSPYIDIYKRNSNTYTDTTLQVRLGWLQGITDADVGLAATDVWGLYSTSVYLKGVIVANTGYIGGTSGWVISTNYIKDVAGVVGLSSVVTGGDDIRLWAGHATPASAPFYVTEAGVLVATSATVSGAITASSGSFGGFTIASDYVKDAADSFGLASTVTAGDDVRFWAGDTFANRATADFRVTEAGAVTMTSATIGNWTVNTTSIYTGTEDHSGYTANAGDITIYSDGSDSSIHAKNFYIDTTGSLNCTSATVSGGITTTAGSSLDGQYLSAASVASAATNIALQGWTQTSAFSATDADTVAWGAGTFTASNGTSYAIGASNTGNMAARTYIYLDIAVSTTAYQTTTTAATAIGNGKVMVAVAINTAGSFATYQVFGGYGGVNMLVDALVANSASTNEFVSNSAQLANLVVTNAKINDLAVSKLTAGTITSKSIVLSVLDTTGDVEIRSGIATGDFANAGAASGFILGVDDSDSNKAKFYIGDATTNLNWNGTTLTITGAITATTGAIGGWSLNSTSIYTGTEDHSGYTTNAGDMTLYSNGTDASIHAKNFYIDTTGALFVTAATVTGSTIDGTSTLNGSTATNVQYRSESAFTSHLFFEGRNTDGLSISAGAGSYTRRLLTTDARTAALADTRAYLVSGVLAADYDGTSYTWSSFNWRFYAAVRHKQITAQSNFIGLYDRATADNAGASTDPTRHIGFHIENGTIYASNANGTDYTITDVSAGITLTDYNKFHFVLTVGVDIKFYINDVLVSTSTTYIPTTNDPAICFLLRTNAAAEKSWEIKNNYIVSTQ